MIYVAFTLGLFGSLHCLGMCGPLAFALLPGLGKGDKSDFFRALGYNVGRTISYTSLGVVSGLLGGLINISGIQKPLSISLGVLLLLLFFMSMDLEKVLFKSSKFTAVYTRYRKFLTSILSSSSQRSSVMMGVLNGFIPCGLVYLAIAGAISTGGFYKGIAFMFFFGLGTFPMMFLLLLSTNFLGMKFRKRLLSVFSYLQLVVGIILIFRGMAIDVPANLELLWSLGNVNCH